MGFVVEAWFRNTIAESVFEILCSGLIDAGFTGINILTPQTISWDCVTLAQHKVFVALSPLTEDHLDVVVKAKVGWDEGYSAFEHVFIHFLEHRHNVELAELLLSTRNSQPWSFLTHSFYRGSFPPTIVNLDEKKISQRGESDYWAKWGPELHFIANEVLERTQVDVASFAHSLAADIIGLEGGALLDCGWTREFALPQQITSN